MRIDSDRFDCAKRLSGGLLLPLCVLALVLVLSTLSGQASSVDGKTGDSPRAGTESPAIKNFGRINEHFFRGAQPRPEDYPVLARLGVKTIVDLRDDPLGYARDAAKSAGLRYISLPLSDREYPVAGSAERFLSIVRDSSNWPVFVHCAGGRHRTGVMAAVYRVTVEGWDIDQAYREMKDYDFYTRWGHQAMKDFIFDYSARLRERLQTELVPATPANAPEEATETGKPQ